MLNRYHGRKMDRVNVRSATHWLWSHCAQRCCVRVALKALNVFC